MNVSNSVDHFKPLQNQYDFSAENLQGTGTKELKNILKLTRIVQNLFILVQKLTRIVQNLLNKIVLSRTIQFDTEC